MSRSETLFFPRSVYMMKVLKRAVADYESICRIELRESAEGAVCRFETTGQIDASLVACEFSNYLIELSNSMDAL